MADNTVATNTRKLAPITDKQIQDVQDLLMTLKSKATDAVKQGDPYMASIYGELVKRVSPIVTRAYMRKDREEKAKINKDVMALRKSKTPFERAREQSA